MRGSWAGSDSIYEQRRRELHASLQSDSLEGIKYDFWDGRFAWLTLNKEIVDTPDVKLEYFGEALIES